MLMINNQAYISSLLTPDGLNNALQDIKRYMKIIKQFLLTHHLLLNESKTEIILIEKKLHEKVGGISLKVGTTSIYPSKQLRIWELFLISN